MRIQISRNDIQRNYWHFRMKLPLDSAVNQPCGNFPALAGQARLCRQKAIYSEQVILLPAHCISGNGDTSIAFSRPLRAIAIALSLAVT
jgi:hypothetical protein